MVSVGMLQWVLTYLVHSTALIGAVWIATKLVPRTPLAVKETMWKLALLGGIFTASVQMASGVTSPWGDLPMPHALAGQRVTAAPAAAPEAVTAKSERRVVVHENGKLSITATRQSNPSVAPAAIAAPTPTPAAPGPWRFIVLGLLAAGSIFAVARLVVSARGLHKQLSGRRDVIEDPVLESFLQLCQKAELKKRPRLTASPHLTSPIALRTHEIVLPERAVDSLSPAQQEGMLAHEIAHLLRRDPLWQVVSVVVEAVLFFQPLNHLARRKIQEIAEYQCDDWAARNVGTGVHLAKCLAEVATWVEDGPPASPITTAMAQPSSPIVRRIKRLLHDGRKTGTTHPLASIGVTVGALGLVTWLAPGVTPAHAEPARAQAQASQGVKSEARLAIVDLEDDDHDRSRLRFENGGEVLEVEVDTPRASVPALPPEPPEPPDDDGDVQIIIRGGVYGSPFGCCDPWHGFLGIDVDGLELHLDGLFDPFDDEDVFALENEMHRALFGASIEEARERAHGHAARAREHAARARLQAERAREAAARARAHVYGELPPEPPAAKVDDADDDDDDDDDDWFSLLGGPAPQEAASDVVDL